MPDISSSSESFEQLYRDLLKKVRDKGVRIVSAEKDKKDNKKPKWITRELIAQTFRLNNPRDRLIINPARRVNIYQAIGQFLWIMDGNYHLNPVAYYADSASAFSSDKKIMTGAYGFRLFGPAHLSQIDSILHNLTTNHTSRRAVASIYMPEFDREYDSNGKKLEDEIPCALNFQFLLRENKLDMVVYMRSQNVHGLLPYDVFIFTMIQEYLAASLHKDLGTYYHFSGSFHIYEYKSGENKLDQVNAIIDDKSPACDSMAKMPVEDNTIYLNQLLDFENQLRTEVLKVKEGFAYQVLRESYFLSLADKMPDYWKQLALMLIIYACSKLGDRDNIKKIAKKLKSPLKTYVDKQMEELKIT